MKTVLFIPGFNESLDARDYTSVIKAIESKRCSVKFVDIKWTRTTITDWVKELEGVYQSFKPSEVILAGFSYGAMIAFVESAKCPPAELWLFSLSPYFSDDIPKLKKWWLKEIGKHRTEAFLQLHFKDLAQRITCPTHIFYGEKEAADWPIVKERARIARQLIGGATLKEVPNTDHDVTAKEYIDAILTEIE